MNPTPYMPDQARAAMPQSPLQPLPPYLQQDFAQSLDRERPHELIVPQVKGKPADPSRMGTLRYRYLDTGETTLVPNIWYNQTVEMRLSWWRFEVERRTASLKQAKDLLAEAEACKEPWFRDQRTEKAVQSLRWNVADREQQLQVVQVILKDVTSGARFL